MGTLKDKLAKGAREVPIEVERFLRRAYPAFVTARRPSSTGDDVPVFMFHKVRPDVFEEQLDFLRVNGYRTLDLAELTAAIEGGKAAPGRSVVLTFDDGDKSWLHVAGPLLERYGFRAVGFLVPHYIDRASTGTEDDRGWLGWDEVARLQRDGSFEFQSHSQFHDRIFTSPELVDFHHPEFEHNPLGLDTPWIDGEGGYTNRLSLGTPIYRHAPRLSGALRYRDEPALREACTTWVAEQGGRRFFDRPDWRARLRRVHAERAGDAVPDFESEAERRQAIREDLERANSTLEQRLGHPVRHLCYPWGAGSPLAAEISRETGHLSNFYAAPDRRAPRSLFHIRRLKDDYVFRLPGRGRKSLLEIFRAKLRRRMHTTDLY